MTLSPRIRGLAVATGLLASLFSLPACVNPFQPRIAPVRGLSEPPPTPNSATNILRLFEWCWDHRAIAEYREVFTDDFEFHFQAADSAGNVRTDPLTRESELETAENLFVRGSANQPPANSIELEFSGNLISRPDGREGKDPRYHRQIAPQVTLRIDTDGADYQITGVARFFVTRGDHAKIPAELLDRGFSETDSTRWYIELWNDETLGDRRIAGLPPLEGLRIAPGSPGTLAAALDAARGAPRAASAAAPATTPASAAKQAARPAWFDPDVVTWGILMATYADR